MYLDFFVSWEVEEYYWSESESNWGEESWKSDALSGGGDDLEGEEEEEGMLFYDDEEDEDDDKSLRNRGGSGQAIPAAKAKVFGESSE